MEFIMKEFKEFLLRGNVVDLAVGVVIGAAFGAVVTSLVKDVLTPMISAIGGAPDFSSLKITLGESAINYGNFLNALIAFLILAAVVFFLVIKPMNRLMAHVSKPAAEKTDNTKTCPECLSVVPIKARRCAHCTTVIKK
jgi:large conductance mechanosensitive channel